VVDDCSTDRTKEVIEQYVEQDSRVKLFSTPQNSGPYVARNIALQEATGEYVTVNDADDWSHAEKIATQEIFNRLSDRHCEYERTCAFNGRRFKIVSSRNTRKIYF